MEIILEGDAEGRNTSDLLNWLRKEHIGGASFTQKRGDQRPDEMGAELIPVIVALLGAPAVVELVKSIHAWIVYRRPKAAVSIRLADGTSVQIDAENIDIETLTQIVGAKISQ